MNAIETHTGSRNDQQTLSTNVPFTMNGDDKSHFQLTRRDVHTLDFPLTAQRYYVSRYVGEELTHVHIQIRQTYQLIDGTYEQITRYKGYYLPVNAERYHVLSESIRHVVR